MMKMRKQLLNIQYLRAFSACAIVLFHAGGHFDVFVPIGQGRVALFFIVSGFVLWWITMGRQGGAALFLGRRLARLVPLYWIVTIITALASWGGLGSHGLVAGGHLVQSLLFIPHGGPIDGKIFPVYFPGWTLTYEMFFCILLSTLLWAPEPLRLWLATALLGGLTAAGFFFHPTDAILYTYTNVIMLEFLSGVWLAEILRKIDLPPIAAGFVLVLGFCLSWLAEPVRQVAPELLASGVPAFMIVFGALTLEKTKQFKIDWLQRIGDSAYSIYIWHWPAIGLAKTIAVRAGVTSTPILIAFTTLCGIGAGLVLYPLIEKPLTAWLMRQLDRASHRSRPSGMNAGSGERVNSAGTI